MSDDEIPADLYPGLAPERVRSIGEGDPAADDLTGGHVLYWMQASVRTRFNHALEYAVRRANELDQPLLVCFGLTDDYPDATLRSYRFLLEGLADVATLLERRHIPFVLQRGEPVAVAAELAEQASLVVCDRGYLRHQQQWYRELVSKVSCPVAQVESNVVVPVELASDKLETAARTIRPKISRHLERFLVELPTTALADSTRVGPEGESLDDLDALLARMTIDTDVPPVPDRPGGPTAAERTLRRFLDERLDSYAGHRMHPETDDVSELAAYLHYGHVSPVQVAMAAQETRSGGEDVESFLEELIVRRELPVNYVRYCPDYDKFSSLPGWAQDTLAEHGGDEPEHTYTRGQLEASKTHDEYWNAAMTELRVTGYMHNYMRMYWGKKILEWSKNPETAFRTCLYLNNRYFLDGRDPSSYANVAWIFGRHDRGWTEREVFGKVRSMTAGGLERKADPQAYVEKVGRRAAAVEEALGDQ